MNYNIFSQKQKREILEEAILTQSPEEVAALYMQLGQVKNTARALGIACRFGGLEHVKVLVEGGANFTYEKPKDEEGYFLSLIYYWLLLLELNETLRSAYFIDRRDSCFTNIVTINKKNIHVLPMEQRAEIVKYLYKYREKVCLDVEELLYYAIISDSKQIIKVLKEYGVKFSKQRITMLAENGRSFEWMEFSYMIRNLNDKKYIEIVGNVVKEMGGKTLHYTDSIYWANCNHKQFRLYNPEFFRFILTHFNKKKMNKAKIMKGAIDQNNVVCLEICAENSWLDMPRKRDEMIKYASEHDRTEASAWLLDFKNRTANFALEREKAEKKMMRELNANPNSVTELKKIWGYEKRDDNTIIITRYRGKNTDIVVPEKIGNSTVVEIGARAFSTTASRLREEQIYLRKAITRILLPETIEVIGESAFYGCQALTQISLPETTKVIGESAFHGCQALTQINIPDQVIQIGAGAFSRCKNLCSIHLPKGITEINPYTFSSCHSLQSVTIPENVTVISKYVFSNCSVLETVVISEGVVEVGTLAFKECTHLKSVVLPQSIRKIKNYTHKGQEPQTIFEGTVEVTAMVIPKSYAEKYCRRNNIKYIYTEK